MMIPIVSTIDQSTVAQVNFVGGGPLTATGKITKIDNGTDSEIQKIRDAVLKFKNFSGELIYTPKGHVQLWRGFWGWFNGLRMVLPSIGYGIDSENIDWP